MSFVSLAYALFLPAVCLLHWLTPSRWRWAVLLCASYIFYASWNAALSLLILGATACAYATGRALEKSTDPTVRRGWLIAGLSALLGLLAYFKYYNLLGESAAAFVSALGRPMRWHVRDIMLPVGISFFTFQAISYIIDVYRGTLKAEAHFGYFALYIAFFPQLVAGPIERAGDLLPQLRAERRLRREDVSVGLRLLVSGFFRKLVAADIVAPFVDAVYRSASPDGSAVCMATLLFAMQIYCDFSGYSEIAAGSARLLGVRLMRNFEQPYGAANLRDFWRRWHISLTVWFTDYVYIPLGGSRRGMGRQVIATFVVFALCGLWHGADWSFVVWGLLHACFLSLYNIQRHRVADRLTMLAAVCFAWVFFRANGLSHALLLISRLFSRWDVPSGVALLTSAARPISPVALLILFLSIALTLRCLPALTEEEPPPVPDAAWVFLLLAIGAALFIRLDSGTANTFIYFQF